MDDRLLMGVLHTLANRREQLQPLGDAEFGFVAELRNWHTINQFHDEEWSPAGDCRLQI